MDLQWRNRTFKLLCLLILDEVFLFYIYFFCGNRVGINMWHAFVISCINKVDFGSLELARHFQHSQQKRRLCKINIVLYLNTINVLYNNIYFIYPWNGHNHWLHNVLFKEYISYFMITLSQVLRSNRDVMFPKME